ncbi:uncharacterized protein [Melanerpes formicivorus]|uniref:uncharacterized protein isoform X2 n=1 Tax=Melanerpes formicivorus TaxID=211600 RepID=UPI00358FEAD4
MRSRRKRSGSWLRARGCCWGKWDKKGEGRERAGTAGGSAAGRGGESPAERMYEAAKKCWEKKKKSRGETHRGRAWVTTCCRSPWNKELGAWEPLCKRAQETAAMWSEPCAEAGTGRAAGKRLEGASVGSPNSRWEPIERAGMLGLGLVAQWSFGAKLGRRFLVRF